MNPRTILATLSLSTAVANAQNIYVYDQQTTGSGIGKAPMTLAPFGQSFTPTLNSISFVQLYLDIIPTNSIVDINILSGSMTGTILGTSMPTVFNSTPPGYYDFIFSSPISLTPGTKYYLNPVSVSGPLPVGVYTRDQYTGGDMIVKNQPVIDRDLVFREGIIVPEPSSIFLFALGTGLILNNRLRSHDKPRKT